MQKMTARVGWLQKAIGARVRQSLGAYPRVAGEQVALPATLGRQDAARS